MLKKSSNNQSKLTSFFSFRPKQFDLHLSAASPCYASLPVGERLGLAAIVWAMYKNTIPHKSGCQNLTPIHHSAKKKIFGSSSRFDKVNEDLGWFVMTLPPRQGHYAAGWELTAQGNRIVEAFFDNLKLRLEAEHEDASLSLIDACGKPFRITKNGIRSETQNGSKCRFPGNVVSAKVKISRSGLLRLCKEACDFLEHSGPISTLPCAVDKWNTYISFYGVEKARKRAKLAYDQAMIILSLSRQVGECVIPTYYVESKAGRLYAVGHVNLQRCVSEVRHAALQGCYDLDIENCHWSILSQMAHRVGITTHHINCYLANKDSIRKHVSNAAGISIDDAKFVLVSLIYGAVLRCRFSGETWNHKKNAIEAKLGRGVVELLSKNDFVIGLVEDIRKCGSKVIDDYKVRTNKASVILNDAGREISVTKEKRKILSHLLQGAESEALRVLVTSPGAEVVLMQHDGVTVTNPPNIDIVEKEIYDITGYKLSLKVKCL